MELLNSAETRLAGPFPRMAQRPINPTSLAAISERLRLLQLSSGLKQAPFSRLVGLSASQWNNYSRGRERISIDAALKVCVATGVSLDFIYRGERAALPFKLALDLQRFEQNAG
jgi:transcriptional regulator with XRE-family HTH domain